MAQTKTEVLIGDTLYDLAGFRHPGGGITKFYEGHGDATEAFKEFHPARSRAWKWMTTLPQRPAPKEVIAKERPKKYAELAKDYAAWREKLVKEGWFEHSLGHMAYRFTEIIAMHALGLYLLLSTPYWFLGILVLGIVQGRCGWLMHECGHFSGVTSMWWGIRLQEWLYGMGCGMSAAWWRSQHNRHHATPQKLHHDVDLDTMPLVAFNKLCLGKIPSAWAKFWIPMQSMLFGPVTTSFVTAFWQFFLHPRLMWRKKLVFEPMWLAARYGLIYFLKERYNVDWQTTILLYLAYNAVGGGYIFCNFALSHTHLDVVLKDEDRHWVEYAANYTININPILPVNWWMGYLNYQIEHHLFPTMPQYKFVKLWPQTKAFFEKHGLKYDCRGYWEAVNDTWTNLATVGKEASRKRVA